MNRREDNYTNILIEDLRGKMDAVLEIVTSTRDEMRDKIKGLAKQEDLLELKSEIHTLRLAVTETNMQVANHEKLISTLETRTV